MDQKNYKLLKSICGFLAASLMIASALGFLFKFIGNRIMLAVYDTEYGFWFWFAIALIPAFLFRYVFYLYIRVDDLKSEVSSSKKKIKELEDIIEDERSVIEDERSVIEHMKKETSLLLESTEPFKYSASIIAGLKAYIFKASADYLDNKWNPAVYTANVIRKHLKERVEYSERMCKEMQFKYEFLLNSIPMLKDFIEPESKLLNGAKSKFQIKWESLDELFANRKRQLEASYIQKEASLKSEYSELQKKLEASYAEKESDQIDKYYDLKRDLYDGFALKERKLKERYDEIVKKEKELNTSKETLINLLKSSKPFSASASIISNLTEAIFNDAEGYLIEQRHAEKAADVVRELKIRVKTAENKMKEMLYKYEFLISIFPELQIYFEDEEELISLDKYENYSDFEEQRDRRRDYLSEDEWQNLSSIEKSQLALDRWKKKDKSQHTIGMLYEMYISYLLRSDGHMVREFGIKNGLNDLGRDLISYKDGNTYIIQCKNWSKGKEIHENVVCQLMGTALEFEISNPFDIVVPVLITTTKLSETAKIFAERLNVKVRIVEMGEFPLIKCNINGNNKIYHLPFDQQYERTEINKPDEMYAWTVKEAEEMGFRRAMRHMV